jgi:hypothetical protein
MAKARVTDLARRLPAEIIQRRIYVIRTHKVMIDSDLAKLYEVATFNLNKAVKRNLSRFPEDFMFRLTADEAECLRFQNGISKKGGRGGRRHLPYAFTEHGVVMLCSVLKSERAVQMNVLITVRRLSIAGDAGNAQRPRLARLKTSNVSRKNMGSN